MRRRTPPCNRRSQVYTRMRVLAPPRPLRPPAVPQAAGGTPAKPVPWNITIWRQRWGAFWGPANREAIRQAMEGAG